MYGAEGGKNPSKLDGVVPAICAELFRRKQDFERRKEFQFEVHRITASHAPALRCSPRLQTIHQPQNRKPESQNAHSMPSTRVCHGSCPRRCLSCRATPALTCWPMLTQTGSSRNLRSERTSQTLVGTGFAACHLPGPCPNSSDPHLHPYEDSAKMLEFRPPNHANSVSRKFRIKQSPYHGSSHHANSMPRKCRVTPQMIPKSSAQRCTARAPA